MPHLPPITSIILLLLIVVLKLLFFFVTFVAAFYIVDRWFRPKWKHNRAAAARDNPKPSKPS